MGYSRLEPGRELEVREYISFQRGRDGFCELIECSVDGTNGLEQANPRSFEKPHRCGLSAYANNSRQAPRTSVSSTCG